MPQQPDLDTILKKYGGIVAPTTPAPIRAGADLNAILKKYGGTIEGSASSSPHDALIDKYATEYGVKPDLVRSLIQQESGGNARAVGPENPDYPGLHAKGLMQLWPTTAVELGVTDPFDPEQNIKAGVAYLKRMIDRYGDEDQALAAYNAGPGNVDKYGGIPPFPATEKYVQKVQAGRGAFQVSDPASTPGQPNPSTPEAVTRQSVTDATPRMRAATMGERAYETAKGSVDTLRQFPPVKLAEDAWQWLNPKVTAETLVNAAAQTPAVAKGLVSGDPKQTADALSTALEASMQVGARLMPVAIVLAPVTTVATVWLAEKAQTRTLKATAALGWDPAYQRLAANVAATTVALLGAGRVVKGAVRGVKARKSVV